MNRDSDEQRAVPQTLCGALQKEANCKCLVLSVLIYGCLAAVTWCRCANVTKVVINFNNYPLKRTEHVSPCDEGYIYIPVAFMGMLYLVYLVECYHSPIRIDLFHADSQDNVMTKLSQLRMAQPTIWWKAVSYHYVRRKRQITRYRNGDNYTTTQVYYERANTHAATSFYFYDYCGVKDISKELTTDSTIPITKITLTKGFAFSNMRSATEFEEARSRFFAEQELRDDYMEMREGLDLGYNFNPTNIVGVLGNPWFTNFYVYWCFSALLLSWPLRIIIEYNTQYADYQVTKLFGVNYDTPTSGDQIHESSSQLSAPGSYMLAPSYSEALLMDPSPSSGVCPQTRRRQREAADRNGRAEPSRVNGSMSDNDDISNADIVPSYSEALLYERAQQPCPLPFDSTTRCECSCHVRQNGKNGSLILPSGAVEDDHWVDRDVSSVTCSRCETNDDSRIRAEPVATMESSWSCFAMYESDGRKDRPRMTREYSAPNFSTPGIEPLAVAASSSSSTAGQFLPLNGNSLGNISENEEPPDPSVESFSRTLEDVGAMSVRANSSRIGNSSIGCGTIPKFKPIAAISTTNETYRLIENPMMLDNSEDEMNDEGLDGDERETRRYSPDLESNMHTSNTYFCLKSILKQHRRRYTLVTAEELQRFASDDPLDVDERIHEHKSNGKLAAKREDTRHPRQFFTRDNHLFRNRCNRDTGTGQSSGAPIINDRNIQRVSSSRSLIFPSPIEEARRTMMMPCDPFGGKAMHVLPAAAFHRNGTNGGIEKPPDYTEAVGGLPRFVKLARSLTSIQHNSNNGGSNKSLASMDTSQRLLVRANNRARNNYHDARRHRRNLSIEPEYLSRVRRDEDEATTSVARTANDRLVVESSIGDDQASRADEIQDNLPANRPLPLQLRRNLRRGYSLYERKAASENETGRKILRSSLIETSSGSTTFCLEDESTNVRHDHATINLSSGSKRFNVSMETSL